MKILLFTLNASHAHGALGIRCLRDALCEAGLEAECLEATPKDRTHRVLARLYEANADLYGFSCYIWNIKAMLSLAQDLKALLPRARIVLGGPEVSFDTERFSSLPFVDCVLTGEGEEAIVQAAALVKAGESLPPVLAGTPYRSFLKTGIHYEKGKDTATLLYYESSRGCPFTCAFCLSGAASDHRVRAKSVEDTLADLLKFEQFPHPLTVKLVDRTFNFDRERAKAIWRGLLAPRYTKCYHFEIAAHLLDEESIELLSRFPSGKIRLEIGLQSTNESTLTAISRHTDAASVLAVAKRLTDLGCVHVHLDLIAGLPHEDLASFARSFDAAYFCCHVLQLGFLKLLHGTPLREKAEQNGTVCEADPPYTVLKTKWLSLNEIELLHDVCDLCERLRDSGRFTHTLALLLPKYLTPFALYSRFAAYLTEKTGKELQKIAQRDLYVHLYEFAKTALPSPVSEAVREALCTDFSAAEVRKPPRALTIGDR